jgi:hypothetical protein
VDNENTAVTLGGEEMSVWTASNMFYLSRTFRDDAWLIGFELTLLLCHLLIKIIQLQTSLKELNIKSGNSAHLSSTVASLLEKGRGESERLPKILFRTKCSTLTPSGGWDLLVIQYYIRRDGVLISLLHSVTLDGFWNSGNILGLIHTPNVSNGYGTKRSITIFIKVIAGPYPEPD